MWLQMTAENHLPFFASGKTAAVHRKRAKQFRLSGPRPWLNQSKLVKNSFWLFWILLHFAALLFRLRPQTEHDTLLWKGMERLFSYSPTNHGMVPQITNFCLRWICDRKGPGTWSNSWPSVSFTHCHTTRWWQHWFCLKNTFSKMTSFHVAVFGVHKPVCREFSLTIESSLG